MLQRLEEIKLNALKELGAIKNAKELESWRVHYLGKKSPLTGILRSLATLPLDEKKAVGSLANQIKQLFEDTSKQKGQELREEQVATDAKSQTFDITLPGRPLPAGHMHPISQTLDEICEIFNSMGFQVVEGPEVEWDYYNFEALNISEEHPARDNMSTSWIDFETDDGKRPMLLRTHTTSVTARVVEKMDPPIRVF